MGTKICPHCGAEISDTATRCYNCKEWLTDNAEIVNTSKPQDFLVTLILCWFLGCFGIHRFVTGNIAIGICQLLTVGGCGIWVYIDLILICFNKYRDAQGRLLSKYDKNIGIVCFVLSLIPLFLILLFIIGLFLAIALPSIMRS